MNETAQPQNEQLVKKEETLVPAFSLDSQLPDLHNKDNSLVIPFNLQSEYWSPEDGESVKGFIQECEVHQFPKRDNPSQMVDVECVKVMAQQSDGTIHDIINGSVRLVDVVKTFMKSGKITPGTPLEITYLGKKKNKTNANESNTWSVKPIAVKTAQ